MKELNELAIIAKSRAENFEPCTFADTKAILAIAEAFWALEQRAEAAEANHQACTNELVEAVFKIDQLESKLAEYEKQEPFIWFGKVSLNNYGSQDGDNNRIPLFTRPAPAVSLAELVPQRKPISLDAPISHEYAARTSGYRSGFNDCVDEILRNIEEAK